MKNIPRRYLNMQEIMLLLGYSRMTILKLIKEKALPAVKVGNRKWLFDKEKIEKYIDDLHGEDKIKDET